MLTKDPGFLPSNSTGWIALLINVCFFVTELPRLWNWLEATRQTFTHSRTDLPGRFPLISVYQARGEPSFKGPPPFLPRISLIFPQKHVQVLLSKLAPLHQTCNGVSSGLKWKFEPSLLFSPAGYDGWRYMFYQTTCFRNNYTTFWVPAKGSNF